MHRILLHSWNQENENGNGPDSTPLRGSHVRLPRLRLLDKEIQTRESPGCPVSNYRPPNVPERQPARRNPQPIPRQIRTEQDRFIPGRWRYSVEAANYLLTKKAASTGKKNRLDVLKQVDSLTVSWKRKFMHQLLATENAIPGVWQKRVLRGEPAASREDKLPGNLAGRPRELWDDAGWFEDGMWKSRPRKKPLIGIMDSILDMPGFQTLPRSRSRQLDWSSRNIIAAGIGPSVIFYDIRLSQTAKLQPIDGINAYSLNWSNSGTKLALCSAGTGVYVYDIVQEKIEWSAPCNCLETFKWECTPRSVCWSYNDQHVVTTCRGLLSIFSAKDGECVNMVLAHEEVIVNLSFSSNYRFLVTTAPDKNIRIFVWPSLVVFLDISYYEPVRAVAWHPEEGGLLCVGGGLGDASLSLWNVNNVDPLSYRRVPFHGAVENLAWNRISGELVVQWSYWEQGTRHTVMPVLSSLDRIVDAVPVERDSPVSLVMWNSDHTQLATQSEDSLSIWNFFGNEYQYRHKQRKPLRSGKRDRADRSLSPTEFARFTIR